MDENGHVIDANILTSDGVLHVLDTLLIPDDIQPLLPRYCNTKRYRTVSVNLNYHFPKKGFRFFFSFT